MFDHIETNSDFITEKTLKASASLTGVGLHTGRPVTVTIHPAPAGNGILFRRLDLLSSVDANDQTDKLHELTIPATPQAVSKTALGTTLSNEFDVSINTVEHLMSAFAGLGIDNALVEVDGPELPIMDGSAEPFIEALDRAGLRTLSDRRLAFRITRKIAVKNGDRWIFLTPNPDETDHGCHMDVMVEYDDPSIGQQHAVFTVSPEHYRKSIAAARTFCNRKDVEIMHERGLALGGSYDNAIVVEDGKILNEGGLRFDGEFVQHKALDLLGDLYLLGRPIIGRVTAFKPGHDLNTRLAMAVLDHPGSFELVEMGTPASERLRAEA